MKFPGHTSYGCSVQTLRGHPLGTRGEGSKALSEPGMAAGVETKSAVGLSLGGGREDEDIRRL